jgi:hypothetical protein
LTNNLMRHQTYGLKGDDRASGLDTIRAYLPSSTVAANVIADGDPRLYPSGIKFPSSAEFRRQFLSYESGDYRLTAGSSWRGAGTDGRDLGALGSVPERRQPVRGPLTREP